MLPTGGWSVATGYLLEERRTEGTIGGARILLCALARGGGAGRPTQEGKK